MRAVAQWHSIGSEKLLIWTSALSINSSWYTPYSVSLSVFCIPILRVCCLRQELLGGENGVSRSAECLRVVKNHAKVR
jgi:hypothetical protein